MRKKVSVVLCGIFVVLLVLCNNPVFADENETYIDNDLCESNETALPDSVPCSTTVALVDELLEGGYSDSLIVINSYQYVTIPSRNPTTFQLLSAKTVQPIR